MPRAVADVGLPRSDAFPSAIRDVGENVALQGFDYVTTIERDQTRSSDTWGQPSRSNWQPILRNVKCIIFTPPRPLGRELDGEPSASSDVNRLHVLMPRDTDVTENDRLSDIKDDAGRVMYAGPLEITGAPAQRASFLDLIVRKIT